MKFFIRRELDTGAPINIRRLKPAMKVYAGIISKLHESKFYKSKNQKRLEQNYAKQIEKDEKLKEALLVLIYKELDSNISLKQYGEECASIVLCIKSSFIHSIDKIKDHKEFLPYELEVVPEDSDTRVAFPDMPILIRVSKRRLGGDGGDGEM